MSQFQPPTQQQWQPPQYPPPPEMYEPPHTLNSTMPTPVVQPPKKRMRRNNKIALTFLVVLILIAASLVIGIVANGNATAQNNQDATATAQAATALANTYATEISAGNTALSNDLTQTAMTPTAMTPTAQPTTPVNTTGVGSTQASGPWSITVHSIKTAVSNNEFEVPKAGNEFILINFTALNTDSAAHDMNPFYFTLRDDTGTSYTFNGLTIAANPDGTVVGGQKLRGDLSYEIPKSVHSLTLQFDPPDDLDNSQIVQWNLTV